MCYCEVEYCKTCNDTFGCHDPDCSHLKAKKRRKILKNEKINALFEIKNSEEERFKISEILKIMNTEEEFPIRTAKMQRWFDSQPRY